MSPPLRNAGRTYFRWQEFFMKHFSEKHRKPIRGFNSLAAVSLQKYPWPGNIRELKNCIQHFVLLSADGWISLEGLNLDLTVGREETASLSEGEKENVCFSRPLKRQRGNRARTARMLSIQPDLLVREIKKIPDYMRRASILPKEEVKSDTLFKVDCKSIKIENDCFLDNKVYICIERIVL